MEENIYEILNSYKDAIDVILGRLDEANEKNHELEERVNKLESILFDEILEPARLSLEEDDRNRRFGEFSEKYGDRLSPFDKVIGAAEGDPEFSLARKAFDDYNELPEPRPDEDVYVDGVIETVEEQIESIKESLGLPSDTEVEIKQDEDGNTEIKADGEVVASEETETKEEPSGEMKQGELDFSDEEEEDNPEDVKKYEEELEKLL
jgi:hypothetical protein